MQAAMTEMRGEQSSLDVIMEEAGTGSVAASAPAQHPLTNVPDQADATAFIHLHSFVSTTIHLPCLERSITLLQHLLSHVVVATELACKLSTVVPLPASTAALPFPIQSSSSSSSSTISSSSSHSSTSSAASESITSMDAEHLELHLAEIQGKMAQLRKTVGDRQLEATFWAWLHALLRSERAWRAELTREINYLRESVLCSSIAATMRGRSRSCDFERTVQQRQRQEAARWTDYEVVERARTVVGLEEQVKQAEHRQGDIGALRRVTIFTLDVLRLVSLPPPPVYHAEEPGEQPPPPYTPRYPFTLTLACNFSSSYSKTRSPSKRDSPSRSCYSSASSPSTNSAASLRAWRRHSTQSMPMPSNVPARFTTQTFPRPMTSFADGSLEVAQGNVPADGVSEEEEDEDMIDAEIKTKRQRRISNDDAWHSSSSSPTSTDAATSMTTTVPRSSGMNAGSSSSSTTTWPSQPSDTLPSLHPPIDLVKHDGGFSHWLDQAPLTVLVVGHALERRAWSLCPSHIASPPSSSSFPFTATVPPLVTAAAAAASHRSITTFYDPQPLAPPLQHQFRPTRVNAAGAGNASIINAMADSITS